ncbi:unnamed protein product [Penicillium olsonii]|uniref:DNA topoisomerase (ATP-hydrolyzing) n=1 Tax=Penicillium olsonii TaxID=99116 RepID=A0A9W4MWK1_PENOL|nr:unnamed protein product [Penicillium olsonii]
MASHPAQPLELNGTNASVRAYIENTLATLVHGLTLPPAEAHLSLILKRRANSASCMINAVTGALEACPRVESTRTYSWPGKTVYEEWKFTVILKVLAILDQAIRTGQLISKRDIYYIDPEFFRAQYVIDGIIDDLAYTIGVDRGALNVDTLIPRIEDGDQIEISQIRWVLVIEKEGKGYPDLSTRLFLRKLFDLALNRNRPLRFYALTDGDPHGMAIMSTYKYGSAAHLHENARLSIPQLQWLGLRVSDIIAVPEVLGDKALLSLTERDRRKIISMLRNSPVWACNGPEKQWRAELQRMLFLNAKAEIEILYECSGGLEGWIERRMFRQE